MPAAFITPLPDTEPAYLFRHYHGETSSQETFLSIDLRDGEVTCGYNPEIGNSVPASVYHHAVLRLDLPTVLATEHANALLTEALPIAQRIIDGSSVQMDRNGNEAGRFDPAGEAAYTDLVKLIATYDDERYSVCPLAAEEYFEENADCLPAITAGTTDAEITALAEEVARQGYGCTDAAVTVLTGAEEFLTDLRDGHRDDVADRLQQVGKELGELKAERDRLILEIHGWNAGDSLRSIGVMAGLSHTRVDRIIQAARTPAPVQRCGAEIDWRASGMAKPQPACCKPAGHDKAPDNAGRQEMHSNGGLSWSVYTFR